MIEHSAKKFQAASHKHPDDEEHIAVIIWVFKL